MSAEAHCEVSKDPKNRGEVYRKEQQIIADEAGQSSSRESL